MTDVGPASHNMWKRQWVATETLAALTDREFREFLTESYRLVRAGLPAKLGADLDARDAQTASRAARRRRGGP